MGRGEVGVRTLERVEPVDGGGHREASLLQADLHHPETLGLSIDEQQVLLGQDELPPKGLAHPVDGLCKKEGGSVGARGRPVKARSATLPRP